MGYCGAPGQIEKKQHQPNRETRKDSENCLPDGNGSAKSERGRNGGVEADDKAAWHEGSKSFVELEGR